MRDGARMAGMFLAGLLIAGVGYPFLHEAGHSAAALIVGAEVVDFNLFPLPNVLCNVGRVRLAGKVLIGAGGLLLPVFLSGIVSALLKRKHFWIWYANLLIKGISLLAAAISFAAVLLFRFGIPIEQEDFTQIIEIWPAGWKVLSIGLSLMIACLSAAILREHPMRKCLAYFA